MQTQKIYLVISIATIFLVGHTAFGNGDNKSLPYPYNTITVLPFDSTGFFGKRQADGLSYLIARYKPKIVVEIGSYLGASTRFIAKLLPESGRVYAVDHWMGSDEWKDKPNFKEMQSLFYQKFLSNVIHEKLWHKIIPMRMHSLEAAKIIAVTPDFVFIDGAHDYQSVYNDICAWSKRVSPNGVLCGDDYNWGRGDSVKRAVNKFAEEHALEVKLFHNYFWYYEKK